MADEEQLILPCDKCGARLKLKPMQAKMLRDVKCGKCGNRIPTSKAVPASQLPAVPIVETAPPPAPEPEPEQIPEPEPPPVAVRAEIPVAMPDPVAPPAAEKPKIPRIPDIPFTPPTITSVSPETMSIKALTSHLPTTESSGSESPAQLRKRIRDLENEVGIFRNQVLSLEATIARQKEESSRFQELLQRAADAEDRAAELQELWYQKEKEFRDFEAKAHQIEHERDEAYAIRESVMNNIKDLMATYHASEVEAARKRLAELDDRMDRFVALIRAREAPSAPTPGPVQRAPSADDTAG